MRNSEPIVTDSAFRKSKRVVFQLGEDNKNVVEESYDVPYNEHPIASALRKTIDSTAGTQNSFGR